MNTAPRVNYPLPLLATIAGTLVVVFMLAVLSFFAAANSWRQFTEPADDPGGATCLGAGCAVLALVMVAAIPFFIGAVISAIRDLSQPLQTMSGRLADKYNRRGSYWIAVRADDGAALGANGRPASTPAPDPLPMTDITPTDAAPISIASRAGAVVWEAPPPATDFGAGLAQAEQQVRRPAAEPLPPPPIDRTNSRVFRVDKPVYDALQVGDPLSVAHSRFLEHVYYVERRLPERIILRNKSLI